jgi:hypothetical protein
MTYTLNPVVVNLVWNNVIFQFDGNIPIATNDLWSILNPISREVNMIFSEINYDGIKKMHPWLCRIYTKDVLFKNASISDSALSALINIGTFSIPVAIQLDSNHCPGANSNVFSRIP